MKIHLLEEALAVFVISLFILAAALAYAAPYAILSYAAYCIAWLFV
jgi:hypothetical protein